MSRSYKHFGFCKDRKSSRWGKRQANKKVRKTRDIPNGKAYKKLVEPWDYICDYCFHETWESYKQWCEQPRWWQEYKEPSYWEYYKTYKMK